VSKWRPTGVRVYLTFMSLFPVPLAAAKPSFARAARPASEARITSPTGAINQHPLKPLCCPGSARFRSQFRRRRRRSSGRLRPEGRRQVASPPLRPPPGSRRTEIADLIWPADFAHRRLQAGGWRGRERERERETICN